MRRVMAVALSGAMLAGCSTASAKPERKSTPAPSASSSPSGAPAGGGAGARPDAAVQEDLDRLGNHCLGFAFKQIEETGGLYPFGGMLTTDGEMKGAVAKPDDIKNAKSEEIIGRLVGGLRAQAAEGKLRAACVVAGGRMAPSEGAKMSDAVQARLEHRDGAALEVYITYTVAKDKKITPGEPVIRPGTPMIFTAAPPPSP